MILIRVTFKDGRKFFVNETKKGITLVGNIKNAFEYKTTLEFKVTWKLVSFFEFYENDDYNLKKEDAVKFEYIDPFTLETKPFDVKENEIEIGDDLYVDPITFRQLIDCPVETSHWAVDKDDNFIFPSEEGEEYDKVVKIGYFNRGLMHTIKSKNSWIDRYNKHSWHQLYDLHHRCMHNPIIQQICLLNFDACHKFTIYKKKIN